MSLKTNHILFLDFLFAYFTIYVICLYGLLSCKSRKLTLIWQDCTDLYLLWTIFSFFAFSFTSVISKIQKKNPENIAKTSIHSAVDVGPFRINAVKGNCLTCFPQHLWWNCSYSISFKEYRCWLIYLLSQPWYFYKCCVCSNCFFILMSEWDGNWF